VKKKHLLWLLIPILAMGGWFGYQSYQKKNAPPEFQEAEVVRGNLEIKVLATGVVAPENRLELKPPTAGRVESLSVVEGQKVGKGQILAWLSSSERAALLDAAEAKGPAEVAHWEELFKPTPLLAPLDGLIIVKNVVPGQIVTAADSVLVMSDHLIVNTQVDETDIGRIQLHQTAALALDAYPAKPFAGKVTRIAYESKTVNNVTIYEVEVTPDTVPDFMRSGMTVNVTFLADRRDNVLLVPSEAVHQRDNKFNVLVDNPQNPDQPKRQPIEVGLTDGKNSEVLSGLSEGEKVLIPLRKGGKGAAATSSPFSPFGGARPPRGTK